MGSDYQSHNKLFYRTHGARATLNIATEMVVTLPLLRQIMRLLQTLNVPPGLYREVILEIARGWRLPTLIKKIKEN